METWRDHYVHVVWKLGFCCGRTYRKCPLEMATECFRSYLTTCLVCMCPCFSQSSYVFAFVFFLKSHDCRGHNWGNIADQCIDQRLMSPWGLDSNQDAWYSNKRINQSKEGADWAPDTQLPRGGYGWGNVGQTAHSFTNHSGFVRVCLRGTSEPTAFFAHTWNKTQENPFDAKPLKSAWSSQLRAGEQGIHVAL